MYLDFKSYDQSRRIKQLIFKSSLSLSHWSKQAMFNPQNQEKKYILQN